MVKVPTYEARERIQPQANLSGTSNALEGLGRTFSTFSNVASNMANEASAKRAQLEGLEAGQTPGRKLLPEFTPTGKAFVDAYNTESYNNVSLQAQNALQKQLFEASKNPSLGTLGAYEKASKSTIENLSSLVPEEMKYDFRRRLESAATDGSFKLQNAIEAKNQQILRSQFDASVESDITRLADASALGDSEAIAEVQKDLERSIGSQQGIGLLLPHKAQQTRQVAKMTIAKGLARNALDKAREEKTDAQLLDEWTKTPPEFMKDLSIEERDEALLYGYRHNQQIKAFSSAQQDVYESQFEQLRLTGQLTPQKLEEAQEVLEAPRFAQLELSVAKDQMKELGDLRNFNMISEVSNNAMAMSQFTDGQKNEYWKRLVNTAEQTQGAPVSFEQKVGLMEGIHSDVPSFTNEVKAMVGSGNVEQAAAGLMAYNSLFQKNPLAVQSLSSLDKLAVPFQAQIEAGIPVREAVAKVIQNVSPKTPDEWQQLESNYKNLTSASKGLDFNNLNTVAMAASKDLDIDTDELPVGILNKYKSLVQANYMEVGGADLDNARKMAARQLGRVYGETNINGKKEYVYRPIEQTLPNGKAFVNFVRNQFVQDTHEVLGRINQGFEEGLNNFRYEPKPGTIAQDQYEGIKKDLGTLLKPVQGEKEFKVTRVDHGGEKVEGAIIFKSDAQTTFTQDGSLPTYSVWFRHDEIDEPVNLLASEQLRLQPKLDALVNKPEFSEADLRMFEKVSKKVEAANKTFRFRTEEESRPFRSLQRGKAE